MGGRAGSRRVGVSGGPGARRVGIGWNVGSREEGPVAGGRGGREMGAGLKTPQQLLVISTQTFLFVGLLLHVLLKVGVLLRQLPVTANTSHMQTHHKCKRSSQTKHKTV